MAILTLEEAKAKIKREVRHLMYGENAKLAIGELNYGKK